MKHFNPWILLPLGGFFLVGTALSSLIGSLPRTREMTDQISIKAQEGPMRPPALSIPIGGKEKRRALFDAIDLENPIQADPEILASGRHLYEIYCSVCHGADGKGHGPISEKLTPPAIDLTDPYVMDLPDGYLYTVIREGGTSMPPQEEGLSPEERWHIVHYLRTLQRGG